MDILNFFLLQTEGRKKKKKEEKKKKETFIASEPEVPLVLRLSNCLQFNVNANTKNSTELADFKHYYYYCT